MASGGSFKRINFFKGFLATEEDFNDAENYHLEKRHLHNQAFHAPGVVSHYGDGLRVTSRGRGDLSLEIGAGYAIDGLGRDIYIPEKQIKTISAGDFKLPQTIYVVVKYIEEMTDFIRYKEVPDYQGHRRIQEGFKIEFTNVEPDVNHEIELGRIYLEKGAKRIIDAKDPDAPGPNEIDLRFVRFAGTVGMFLSSMLRVRLREAIAFQKRVFSHLSRVKKIISAQDAHHALITLDMLTLTAHIGHDNIWELLIELARLEWDVVNEAESRVPDLSARREFTSFKKNIEIMYNFAAEKRRTDEGLDNVITYMMKTCESIEVLLDQMRSTDIEVKAMTDAPKESKITEYIEGGITFEELKTYSKEFTETLIVDGREWVLVDMLDVRNEESEASHEFRIKEAKDTYRSRQKLRYPDGTVVEDQGIAHEGGYSEFKVVNVTPHQDLVCIRRMDYVRADYQAEIHVNGARMDRIMDCSGSDRKFRWRNWPYVVPAQHISSTVINIKQVMLTADRDINMFRYWFYQPK